ncbi:hypothetical protein EVAR_81965_1 [Eumeta japonica]|uniref:Uncharacterized protein n=1 Tax=Eumeta variegata TaxID=151549 RepID=A0A4C1VXF8_EUMVA|nr:hypothetical protein EVAR_81965_1 [Eumeta japonica]
MSPLQKIVSLFQSDANNNSRRSKLMKHKNFSSEMNILYAEIEELKRYHCWTLERQNRHIKARTWAVGGGRLSIEESWACRWLLPRCLQRGNHRNIKTRFYWSFKLRHELPLRTPHTREPFSGPLTSSGLFDIKVVLIDTCRTSNTSSYDVT